MNREPYSSSFKDLMTVRPHPGPLLPDRTIATVGIYPGVTLTTVRLVANAVVKYWEGFIFGVRFGGERVQFCLRPSDCSSKLSDVSRAVRPMDQGSPNAIFPLFTARSIAFRPLLFGISGQIIMETVLWTVSRLCPLLSAVKPNTVNPNGDIELGSV